MDDDEDNRVTNMENHDDMSSNLAGVVQEAQGDKAVAQLLNLAGLRQAIPVEVQQRVHAGVKQEWRSTVRRQRAVRWSGAFALAASILLGVTFSLRPTEVPLQKIGTVARALGATSANDTGFVVGRNVHLTDTLTTASEQSISIVLLGGLSLRIAADSSIQFNAADDFTLARGQVYIDSGQAIYRDHGITIRTPVGSATDIGTQFAVQFTDGKMRVAVREGRVDVLRGQESYSAIAGEKLLLQTNESVVVSPITVNDKSWDWAVALAPAFDMDGKPFLDLLKWAARETGKDLVFSSDAVRMAAMRSILSGSVESFSPSEAILFVATTTHFQVRIDEFKIVVSR